MKLQIRSAFYPHRGLLGSVLSLILQILKGRSQRGIQSGPRHERRGKEKLKQRSSGKAWMRTWRARVSTSGLRPVHHGAPAPSSCLPLLNPGSGPGGEGCDHLSIPPDDGGTAE